MQGIKVDEKSILHVIQCKVQTAPGPICSFAGQRAGVADESSHRRFDLWSQDVRHTEISHRRVNSSVDSVSARPKIQGRKVDSSSAPNCKCKRVAIEPRHFIIFSLSIPQDIDSVSQLPLSLLHRGASTIEVKTTVINSLPSLLRIPVTHLLPGNLLSSPLPFSRMPLLPLLPLRLRQFIALLVFR